MTKYNRTLQENRLARALEMLEELSPKISSVSCEVDLTDLHDGRASFCSLTSLEDRIKATTGQDICVRYSSERRTMSISARCALHPNEVRVGASH